MPRQLNGAEVVYHGYREHGEDTGRDRVPPGSASGSCRTSYGTALRHKPGLPRVPWSDGGYECACCGGYKDAPYMQFADTVAGWGDEWVMSRSAILTWLSHNRAQQ